LRSAASFLLRAAAAYAAAYAVWLPLRPGFTRLVAAAARPLLLWLDDPVLISNLVARGTSIELHSPLAGGSGALAGWNAVDLTVFLLAPLALAVAVPGGGLRSKLRILPPLIAALTVFCIALAVVQMEIAAGIHAEAHLGLRLHSPARTAWLARINGALHVVGMLALPAFVFLATWVHAAWLPSAREAPAAPSRQGPWRVPLAVVAVVAAGIGATVLLAPAPPAKDAEHDLRLWARIVELNPRSAPARVNLGLALERTGDASGAAAAFREAARIDPGLAAAHYNLGNSLRLQDRLDEAAASYGTALGLAPDHADTHRNLGVTLARLGRACAAADHLRRGARLDPAFAADPGLRSSLQRLDEACGSPAP
jgi:hypothetical protein